MPVAVAPLRRAMHSAATTPSTLTHSLTDRLTHLHRGVGRRAAGGLGDRADVCTEVEWGRAEHRGLKVFRALAGCLVTTTTHTF